MIRSHSDLREYIESDNKADYPMTLKQKLISAYGHYPTYTIKRYLKYLRKQEYYVNTAKKNIIKRFLAIYYGRKTDRLGNYIGMEIAPNCFEKGLTIYHIGSVIVNPKARIGENCKLHGANCIGNNGKTEGVPIIGKNVDIGYGAVIIGNIEIADDVIIGANAVVNKSVLIPGSVVVGVSAKVVNEKDR